MYSYGTNANMPFACPDDDIGEIVCSTDTGAMITSGGGFSNRFPRPSYQDAAVRLYLGRDGVPPAVRHAVQESHSRGAHREAPML